jgi:hypothetical protein
MPVAGNEHLLLVLGDSALSSVDGLRTYFTVQHRHPDRKRWLDLAHYADRSDAERAMRSAIEEGHAVTGELRVRKIAR